MDRSLWLTTSLILAFAYSQAQSGERDNANSKDSFFTNSTRSLPNYRISVSYGFSTLFGARTYRERFEDLSTELESGNSLRASFHYFGDSRFGLGLSYSRYGSSVQMVVDALDSYTLAPIRESIKGRLAFNYAGVSGMGREEISDGLTFKYGLSFGVFLVKHEFEGFGIRSSNTDRSFAGEGEINLDYSLSNQIAIGAGLAVNLGPIVNRPESGTDSFTENRIDFFVGLRFNFY